MQVDEGCSIDWIVGDEVNGREQKEHEKGAGR